MSKHLTNSKRMWLAGAAALLGLASVGAIIQAPPPPPVGPCEKAMQAVEAYAGERYDVTECNPIGCTNGVGYILDDWDTSSFYFCATARSGLHGCRTVPEWRLTWEGRRRPDTGGYRPCKCADPVLSSQKHRWIYSAERCTPAN